MVLHLVVDTRGMRVVDVTHSPTYLHFEETLLTMTRKQFVVGAAWDDASACWYLRAVTLYDDISFEMLFGLPCHCREAGGGVGRVVRVKRGLHVMVDPAAASLTANSKIPAAPESKSPLS